MERLISFGLIAAFMVALITCGSAVAIHCSQSPQLEPATGISFFFLHQLPSLVSVLAGLLVIGAAPDILPSLKKLRSLRRTNQSVIQSFPRCHLVNQVFLL